MNSVEKGQVVELGEKHVGYTMKEAIEEAKRCLYCKNPLCVQGCPIEHKIPEWIHQLSKGNMGGAMELINEKSNLPAICGRVCPHEKQCEGHCILNKKEKPIRVGKLEGFIADFDSDMKLLKERLTPKERGKVAIIGSGPAGLTVAGDLARVGFNVVVFEKQKEPGGILLYGIPEYRLPNEIVQREVQKIEALGVLFRNNCVVGTDITIKGIFDDGFDAIFIGSGTAIPHTLDIKGIDLPGVFQSSTFLRQVSLFVSGAVERNEVPVLEGDNVVVIGGGNVAMDAARTALRMGANKVTVVYRGKEESIPALRQEYVETVEEGAHFIFEAVTEELIGTEKNGKSILAGICLNTTDGKIEIPIDKLILAIGSKPANHIISSALDIEVDDKGYLKTKEHPYGMTSRKGVFAGVDVVHTPQTVVLAMREAKKVAMGIAKYVDAVKLLAE